MSYDQSLAWLFSLTDLERQPMTRATGEQMGLARPAALVARLGEPWRNYRTILVAGSKGKGSTAVLLAGILQAAGYHTGLYSSPHLHSYRERIRVDGAPISKTAFAAEVARLEPLVQALALERPELGVCTTFEVTTALALDHFAREKVEVAVVEVGLGGRLDATNIVEADLSLITPISFEHTAVLGNTLGEIAFEKAGIIKSGHPVLSAPQHPEALAVLVRIAAERQASLGIGGQDWTWRGTNEEFQVGADRLRANLWADSWRHDGLSISLLGAHQLENAATAVAAAVVLSQHYALAVEHGAIVTGLAMAHWPGRIEAAPDSNPIIVLDGAHNGDSAEKLAAALRAHFKFERLWLVFGVLGDKDIASIIAPLAPFVATAWTVKTRHPRALEAATVAARLNALGVRAIPAANTADALAQARASASSQDLICVTGSLSTAAEAREALGLVSAAERD